MSEIARKENRVVTDRAIKVIRAVLATDAKFTTQNMIAEKLDVIPQTHYLFSKGLIPGAQSYGRNSVSMKHGSVLRSLNYSKELTLYSWKHTGVVAAYRNGIDVYAIMRQLRHHSLDQTMIYLKSLGIVKNVEFAGKMV